VSQGTASVIGGRYPLDVRIATGGMGEVWRGTDLVMDRPVAVKILRREYADDATFLDRFRAEAHSMAALAHPGIAVIHDYGELRLTGASVPYIVMELVPGEPLSTIIDQSGPLTVGRTLHLLAQVADALQAAHEAGVVHRDVKPANLLVTPDDTVKVTDFGIARAADALSLTRTGTVMGTAHYLAPELASRGGLASPSSDVYALGVVLYECLAGHRPFPGDNPVAVALAHVQERPPQLPEQIPEPVRRLVELAMAKNPQDRIATAAELARQLRALHGTGELAEPVRLGSASADVDPGDAAVTVAPPEPVENSRKLHDHEERAGRRGAGPLMVAGALLLALSAGWLLWSMGPGSAVVPDVTRIREADARARIAGLGFPIEIQREVNRNVPPGVVIKQRPVPGTETSLASPVLLVVSAGPPRVRIDDADWAGRPFDEVERELRQRGLVVAPRVVEGPGSAGTVADVAPDGLVLVGDSVTVTVIETLGRNE
jgi:eukaryotic-like serine/threonine-protein kinase